MSVCGFRLGEDMDDGDWSVMEHVRFIGDHDCHGKVPRGTFGQIVGFNNDGLPCKIQVQFEHSGQIVSMMGKDLAKIPAILGGSVTPGPVLLDRPRRRILI